MDSAPGAYWGSLTIGQPVTSHQNAQSGAAADMEQNQFPKYKDADVHIFITGSRQYQLHSSILKSVSPAMKDSLTDEVAATLTKQAIKKGATTRFHMRMVDNWEENEDKLRYTLELIPGNDDGRPVVPLSFSLDLENGRVVPQHVQAYHAVLGAIYNVPIDLGDFAADSMSEILTKASSIIDIAEYLDCILIITKPIEATLLATGQLLQQSIANNPVAWLDFAYRIESRALFREALVHAAGKYNTPEVKSRISTLHELVQDVLHKKGKALIKAMQDAELKILSYYPTHIQREKTVGRADKDSIGRASYANDVMMWMALSAVRHFFGQNVTSDATHNAQDMGYEMVTLIMKGGDAYLNKGMMDAFHRLFPMSKKGEAVVESKILEIKEFIKVFVKDLAKNESQLDTNAFPVAHFTCTTVNMQDYPWITGYTQAQDMHDSSDDSMSMSISENDGDDEKSLA